MYKDLYGKDLPDKIKPFQISALVSSALLGWLMIRPKVLRKFLLCKDVEFVAIVYLLEEVLPLIFFQYSVYSRGGNLEEYMKVMKRIAIIFILWGRKHYDKATLSLINDFYYQKENVKDYFEMKYKHFSSITEKKVETFHSLLRNDTAPHYNAEQIASHAKVIAASKHQHKFRENFQPEQQNSGPDKDQTVMAGTAADCILNCFKRIAANVIKSKHVRY